MKAIYLSTLLGIFPLLAACEDAETAVKKGKSAAGAIQKVYKENEEEIGEVSGKVRDLSSKLFHEAVRKVGDAVSDEKDSVPSAEGDTTEP